MLLKIRFANVWLRALKIGRIKGKFTRWKRGDMLYSDVFGLFDSAVTDRRYNMDCSYNKLVMSVGRN